MSGLFNEASLVLVPSGYKSGKVYAEIPTNGNGDLTFTRASSATRTASGSIIESPRTNLLSWSEDFSNTYYGKALGTLTPNSTIAPDGSLTADLFTKTSGVNTVSQISTAGSPYLQTGIHTLSVYIKQNVANAILLRLDNADNTANFQWNFSTKTFSNTGANAISSSFQELSNGWFRLIVTGNVTSTAWTISVANLFQNPTNDSFYVWGAQLEVGPTATTYIPTTSTPRTSFAGIIQNGTSGSNIARLDYTYGSCPSVLLEPQRTNLALYSEQFDNASWTKSSSSITANSVTSPDGTTNADTFESTTNMNANVTINQPITIVSGTTYSTSIYVKANTQRFIFINFSSSGSIQNFVTAIFDLNDFTLGQTAVGSTSGTLVSTNIQQVSNGFYRITIVASINRTDGRFRIGFASAKTGNFIGTTGECAVTNTLGQSIYLYGAQLEAGAYPTTYIPTTSATATRVADSFSRNNIYTNGLITSSGGTWFVELRNNTNAQRDIFSSSLYIADDTTTQTNGFVFAKDGSTGYGTVLRKRISSVETVLFNTAVGTIKIAIKWNGSTADVFQNGTKVVSATSFTPTNMQFLIGNGNDVPKFIQQMALYPTPLDDIDCEVLTDTGYVSYSAMATTLGYTVI